MSPAAVAIAAVVLAGGRSRRMGRDKAMIPLPACGDGDVDGEPAVARVCRAVAAACDPVLLVAAADQVLPELPHVRLIRDPRPFEGPLVATRFALASIAPDEPGRVLLTGVDALRLTPELIRAVARAGDGAVAVADGERLQPLPVVVPVREARLAAERLHAGGERRLRALVQALAPRRVSRGELLDDEDLRRIDPGLLGLEDADDPEALARLARA